jgi:Pyruvate/2-oxoacid:ferredoxin oxidoreductase delta subunit
MSDYTVTHADYDKHHRDQDFEAWLDSLPPEPEAIAVPTCGMCVYFVPDRRFQAVSDGREIISPSHCKKRALADLPPFYKASDSAENCSFFEYDYPF